MRALAVAVLATLLLASPASADLEIEWADPAVTQREFNKAEYGMQRREVADLFDSWGEVTYRDDRFKEVVFWQGWTAPSGLPYFIRTHYKHKDDGRWVLIWKRADDLGQECWSTCG